MSRQLVLVLRHMWMTLGMAAQITDVEESVCVATASPEEAATVMRR